jgi:hypothetical protein
MIQANELRIGNYVKIKYNDHIYKVWEIRRNVLELDSKKGDTHISSISFDSCLPIELTEDVFLRCGGKLDDHNDVFVHLDEKHDLRFYLTNGFIQLCKSYHAPLSNFNHIEYLHQFQNLFFIYSNKELDIKI